MVYSDVSPLMTGRSMLTQHMVNKINCKYINVTTKKFSMNDIIIQNYFLFDKEVLRGWVLGDIWNCAWCYFQIINKENRLHCGIQFFLQFSVCYVIEYIQGNIVSYMSFNAITLFKNKLQNVAMFSKNLLHFFPFMKGFLWPLLVWPQIIARVICLKNLKD